MAREGGGRRVIALVVVIVVFEFGGCDVVGGAVCDGNRMGATHFGRSCFVGGVAGVGNPGLVVLDAFLLDECKETRDLGGLLLRSQGRASALKIAWSLVGALLGREGVSLSCRLSVSQVVGSCSIDVGNVARKDSIFDGIKRGCEIAVGGDVVRHVFRRFDTMGGGRVGLGWRRTGGRWVGHGECCKS